MSRSDLHGPERAAGRADARRHRYGLAVLTVVLALLVAVGAGWRPYARLAAHRADASIGPGQTAELSGVRYRLVGFTVAPTLPADDPTDPPVQGPAGSELVLVEVEQTVLDHTVDLDSHYCDGSLRDDSTQPATVWGTGADEVSLIARPAAYGCGGSSDEPLRYDVPLRMGFAYVVPADRAAQVTARLQVTDGGPTLELHR